METAKTRMKYLDMAKGIGMITIIMFHVGVPEGLKTYFSSFFLPLFYVISGFCFRYEDQFLPFFKKRSKRLLIPYFSYGAILVFGFYVVSGFSLDALLFNIKELLVQMRYTTLWYLASLYFATLLFWLICKITKNEPAKLLVITAVLSGLGMLYDTFVAVPLFWNIDTAVIVQIYLAIGYVCKQKKLEEKMLAWTNKKQILYAVLLLLLDLGMTLCNQVLGFSGHQMYYCQYGCYPLTFIAALCGTFGVIFFSAAVQTKYITYVGKSTMVFFTLHQTIFMEVMFIIYGALGIDHLSTVGNTQAICRVITFVFTMLCCTGVDLLIKKTKLKNVLC